MPDFLAAVNDDDEKALQERISRMRPGHCAELVCNDDYVIM